MLLFESPFFIAGLIIYIERESFLIKRHVYYREAHTERERNHENTTLEIDYVFRFYANMVAKQKKKSYFKLRVVPYDGILGILIETSVSHFSL